MEEKWVDGRGSLPADMDGDGEHMPSTELGENRKGRVPCSYSLGLSLSVPFNLCKKPLGNALWFSPFYSWEMKAHRGRHLSRSCK